MSYLRKIINITVTHRYPQATPTQVADLQGQLRALEYQIEHLPNSASDEERHALINQHKDLLRTYIRSHPTSGEPRMNYLSSSGEGKSKDVLPYTAEKLMERRRKKNPPFKALDFRREALLNEMKTRIEYGMSGGPVASTSGQKRNSSSSESSTSSESESSGASTSSSSEPAQKRQKTDQHKRPNVPEPDTDDESGSDDDGNEE